MTWTLSRAQIFSWNRHNIFDNNHHLQSDFAGTLHPKQPSQTLASSLVINPFSNFPISFLKLKPKWVPTFSTGNWGTRPCSFNKFYIKYNLKRTTWSVFKNLCYLCNIIPLPLILLMSIWHISIFDLWTKSHIMLRKH